MMYARQRIAHDNYNYLAFEKRDDGSIHILGHWRGPVVGDVAHTGEQTRISERLVIDKAPAEEVTHTFRPEMDASGFIGRVWLTEGEPSFDTNLPPTGRPYIVANPQHYTAYSGR